jgi:hypothetical protein
MKTRGKGPSPFAMQLIDAMAKMDDISQTSVTETLPEPVESPQPEEQPLPEGTE